MALANITQWRTLVRRLVKTHEAGTKILDEDVDDAILDAVDAYAKRRPRERVEYQLGAGAGVFDYNVPTGWVSGFSHVLHLEHPLAQSMGNPVENQSPEQFKLIAHRHFVLDRTSDTQEVIRFVARAIATNEYYKLVYAAPHVVSDTESTVRGDDERAVAKRAAASVLEQLATFFIGSVDGQVAADGVSFRSKSDECMRLATQYKRVFWQAVGLKPDGSEPVKAASFVTDLQVDNMFGGDRILHPRRFR